MNEQDTKNDSRTSAYLSIHHSGTQTSEVADESSHRARIRTLSKEKKDLEKSVKWAENRIDKLSELLHEEKKSGESKTKEVAQSRTRIQKLETSLEQANRGIVELEQKQKIAAAKADAEIQESKRITNLLKELRQKTVQSLSIWENKCYQLQDEVRALRLLNNNLQEAVESQRKAVEDGKEIYEFTTNILADQVKLDLKQLKLYDDLADELAERASRPSYDAKQRHSTMPLGAENMAEMLNCVEDFRRGTLSTVAGTPISAIGTFSMSPLSATSTHFMKPTILHKNSQDITWPSQRDQDTSQVGTSAGHGEDPNPPSPMKTITESTESRESSEGTSSSVSYHTKHTRRRSSALVSAPCPPSQMQEMPAAASPKGDVSNALGAYSASRAGSGSNTRPNDTQTRMSYDNQPMPSRAQPVLHSCWAQLNRDQDILETSSKDSSVENPDEQGESFKNLPQSPRQGINEIHPESLFTNSNGGNNNDNNLAINSSDQSAHTYHAIRLRQAVSTTKERFTLHAKLWWGLSSVLTIYLTICMFAMRHIPSRSLSVIGSNIMNLPTMMMHSVNETVPKEAAPISKAVTVRLQQPNPTRPIASPNWMTSRLEDAAYVSVAQSLEYFPGDNPGETVTETRWITVAEIKNVTSTITKTQPIATQETLTETEKETVFHTAIETITATVTQQTPLTGTECRSITLTETETVAIQLPKQERPCPTEGDVDGAPNLAGPGGGGSSARSSIRHVASLESVYSTLWRYYKMVAWMKPALRYLPPTNSNKPAEDTTPAPASVLVSVPVSPAVQPSPTTSDASPFSLSSSPSPPSSPAPPPPEASIRSSYSPGSCTRPYPPPASTSSGGSITTITHPQCGARQTPTRKYRAPILTNGTKPERQLSEILPEWALTDPDRYEHVMPGHLHLVPWLRRLCAILRFDAEEWVRRSL